MISKEVKEKKDQIWFQPGSNRRPSACKADVITTTLWNQLMPCGVKLYYYLVMHLI